MLSLSSLVRVKIEYQCTVVIFEIKIDVLVILLITWTVVKTKFQWTVVPLPNACGIRAYPGGKIMKGRPACWLLLRISRTIQPYCSLPRGLSVQPLRSRLHNRSAGNLLWIYFPIQFSCGSNLRCQVIRSNAGLRDRFE